MNIYCQLSSKVFIVLVFITRFTFGQDHTPTQPSIVNYTSVQNESKDSNITWIQIATSTNDTSQHSSTNCTTTETFETTTNEDQNLDTANNSRRRRRKRRRNKYKASNHRRQQDQYKKHSTRVQLDKPIQFLIPPDYQENLIPKETTYYKGRNEPEKFHKKIPPPVRYLLPPFFDPSFVPEPPQEQNKSKFIEWSPNTSNRGSTKFKHTVYYSDSGNEIISSYDVKSTTPTPQLKHTTLQPRTEPAHNFPKQYKPIVVQPMPIQYTTQALVNNSNHVYKESRPRDQRINNLVSHEVANAGMQVINMSVYQKQLQNQFVSPQKQFTPPPVAQAQPQQQIQQTSYQPYQQLQPPFLSNPASQVYHEQLPVQTYNQQYSNQNYQQQTTYSRPPEIRTTTPVIEFTINRTTTPRIEPVDNFKGLELAESKYFSDIPSEQEFTEAAQNDQVIPGIAGKDYPVFDQTLVQKRRFACRGLEGYFADTSSRCQVFYICNGDGAGEPMLCPNGTLFSQELLVCDWWYNVDC